MSTTGFLVARLAGNKPLSRAGACFAPMLDAMSWHGTPRQLAEAMVGDLASMDVQDLRNSMANLNYRSWPQATRLKSIDHRLLPCLFAGRRGGVYVVTEGRRGELRVFDGRTRKVMKNPPDDPRGTAFFFAKEEKPQAIQIRGGSWLKTVARRFEGYGVQLFGLTFLLNMLALATPLFTMAVYDKVIATGDKVTLLYLGVGVGMALFCDWIIRTLRGALLAYLGGRTEMLVGTAVIDKILDLPLARLEKAGIGAQLARLREFEGIRSFFTGPLALAFMEMPFVLIFLVAIAWIGGWIVILPVAMMLLFGILGSIAIRYARTAVKASVEGSADAQTVLVEILQNAHQIKADAAEDIWKQRFRERSTRQALSGLKNAKVSSMVQVIGQFMMLMAGAGTLTIGTIAAANGAMTVGGLIASMALVWRILAPMQMVFVALTRLEEVKNAIIRLDQLMAQPAETRVTTSAETVTRGRNFEGRVTFGNVVLRYHPNHEPALAGVNFDIKPGEIVAIAGANGSGKSSILKLIADLYQPQAGAVFIDGVDTRQINLLDLRQGIAYLPQQTDLFSGTIAENLRLANPIASDEELWAVLRKAGVSDDVETLPDQLETHLTEHSMHQMSGGFLKGLAIARTLLNDAQIVLMDEPSSALDTESNDKFLALMEELRGKKTVILVEHRPSFIKNADRVLVMNRGTITFDGSPAEMEQAAAQQGAA